MDKDQKAAASAYKFALLGFLYQTLRGGFFGKAEVELIRDLDSNPGHLEVKIPGDITLQVIVKTIPEEPDIGDPARTTM